MTQILRRPLAVSLLLAPLAGAQQPPSVVADVRDGTLRDVAAVGSLVAFAQGGRIALVDATAPGDFPVPFFLPELTYPGQVGAIEWNATSGRLFAAVSAFDEATWTAIHTLYLHDPVASGSLLPLAITPPLPGAVNDVRELPAAGVVLVATTSGLSILDTSVSPPATLGTVGVPGGLLFPKRIAVLEAQSGAVYAFVVGTLKADPERQVNGLGVWDLDAQGGFLSPAVVDLDPDPDPMKEVWDPRNHFPGLAAEPSVHYVQFASDLVSGTDTAYVACGKDGACLPIVAMLDVTVPGPITAAPPVVDMSTSTCLPPGPCVPGAGVSALNIASNADGSRMFVNTENVIHVVDTTATAPSAGPCQNVGSYDGGRGDMAFAVYGAVEALWLGIHHQVEHCIQGLAVHPGTPAKVKKRWWISSSDGGVAVPAWDSIYLPTFGGIARFQANGGTSPQMLHTTSAFASIGSSAGPTEHVAFLPIGTSQGYVVTVSGGGGMQAFQVSQAQPDPGTPQTVVQNPSSNVYANDVAVYRSPSGARYVLTDLADRSTVPSTTYYLQAFELDPSSGTFSHAKDSDGVLSPLGTPGNPVATNTHVVEVHGRRAFVGGTGKVFVVDLDDLEDPGAATLGILDELLVQEGVKGIVCDGTHLFLSIYGAAASVRSYAYDPVAGTIGAQIDVELDDAGMNPLELAARMRRHPSLPRLYATGDFGLLYELAYDAAGFLTPLSTYSMGSVMEMQDCRVYDFGSGPRILFVENNEAFSILDPDDGM